MGTVKVYWLIDLIILCKHWRWELSVDYFSGRKNNTFPTKKKQKKIVESVEKLAVHKMPFVVYRSEAENFRDLLSDVSGRKPLKQTPSCSNEDIY